MPGLKYTKAKDGSKVSPKNTGNATKKPKAKPKPKAKAKT